jgi:hypothetical protein
VTGEPQAGGEAAPPRLFDQDSNQGEAAPSVVRRRTSRPLPSRDSADDAPFMPPAAAVSVPDHSVPAIPAPPPAAPAPMAAMAPVERPDPPPAAIPAAMPAPVRAPILPSTAPTSQLPVVAPLGAGLVEAAPPSTGLPRPIPGPDARRPLVRPVPGRSRPAPKKGKAAKRPTFRGTPRLADRIGWRRLLSFIELVIVVAVLGALVAAVIGAIVGAIVVALQKALNG